MRAMKDSGVPWIGEIPEGWNTILIKGILHERDEKSIAGNETLLSLSQYSGIKPKNETGIADSHVAASYEGYKIVHSGDFVMNIMLAWNGSYAVSSYDGMVSPAYCVYYFRPKYCNRYYHYLLKIDGYQAAFKTRSRGIIDSRLRLYPEQFYAFPTLVPPLPEQRRIADFLDKKCGEIDEMVALQEEFISELKAYKQSVITEAVTKGLDPNVPMKDSGVEWIGEMPEEWTLTQLKRFTNVHNGKEIPIELNFSDDNANPVYGSGGIFKYTNDALFEGEAVMFGRKGTLGKPLYVNDRFWVVDTMYYLTYNFDLSAKYGYYQLIAFDWQPFITHTAIPSIVASDIVTCSVPVPPLPEQHQIVRYLDHKCADIDNLIAIKQQKIDELKDYKKSIIYEYVTGKKEVI